MTPVVVTGRHRPHEVMFLVFSLLIGAAFVAGLKPPGTVEQLIPAWIHWVWYGLLLASGCAGVVSFARRDPYRALTLERAAMWGQIVAPLVYAVVLLAYGHQRVAFVAGFMFAWSAASAWRLWQVNREITALARASEVTG